MNDKIPTYAEALRELFEKTDAGGRYFAQVNELVATVTRLEGEYATLKIHYDVVAGHYKVHEEIIARLTADVRRLEGEEGEKSALTPVDAVRRESSSLEDAADKARATRERVKMLEGERDALETANAGLERYCRQIQSELDRARDELCREIKYSRELRAELDRASETKWNPYPDTKPNEGELVLVLLGEEIGPPRQRMSRFERGEFYRFVEPTPNDRIMSVYYAGVKAWSRFNSPSPAPASPVPSERKANVCGDIERNYLNLPSPLPAESGNEASEKFVAKFKSEIDRLFPAGIPATFASTNPLPAERGVCVYEQIGRTDENGNPEVIWRGQCNIEEDVIVAGSLCMCCLRTIQLAEEK